MGAPQEAKTGIHPAFGVVFAMNYMMGSGYLTLPKAYADASVAIGVVHETSGSPPRDDESSGTLVNSEGSMVSIAWAT